MIEISNLADENPIMFYTILTQQMTSLLQGPSYPLANLANACALLGQQLKDINWVGFYIKHQTENKLILASFQGKVACVEIPFEKGVCGCAFRKDECQLVYNVHDFEGHIACDSASNSEIVIPLHHEGKVVGVLDIDSPTIGRFNELDKEHLMNIAQLIEESADLSKLQEINR